MRWLLTFLVTCFAAFAFAPQSVEFEIPWPTAVRTWVDDTGDYSTQATYKSSDDTAVVLTLAQSKKERLVPLTRLSEKDRAIVKCFAMTPKNEKAVVLLGNVTIVKDGDTIKFRTLWGETVNVRMSDIDAPEITQPFGVDATDALRAMVINKSTGDMRLEVTETDKYHRLIGTLYVNGLDINSRLIADGLAWHYVEYSKRTDLGAMEAEARAAKKGLWAATEPPMAPWDWRHGAKAQLTSAAPVTARASPFGELGGQQDKRERTGDSRSDGTSPNTLTKTGKESPADEKTEMVYRTRTGAKYHRAGCRYLSKSSIPITLEQAKSQYSPCSVCKPPRQP